jgi:hypothetical protein
LFKEKGGKSNMDSNNLYKIGKKLGMNKKDINLILNSKTIKTDTIKYISPTESYKDLPGRYGTFSIKDIQ